MPLDASPVAIDEANLADLATEAASLFDLVVAHSGSEKEVKTRLGNLLIHLVETMRAFPNFTSELSAESYPIEAMKAHRDGVSGWLTDLKQMLQGRSSSQVIGNRQNDAADALGSSAATETTTDRDNFTNLEQALIPLLNELTLMLHFHHRTTGKKPNCLELRSKLADVSNSVFTILNEPHPVTPIWHRTLSTDMSPTFVVRQMEEEQEPGDGSSKVVRRERTVCPLAGLPKWSSDLIISREVRFNCHCRKDDHAGSLVYNAQPLESLLLKNLSPENKWSWEIVLFKGKKRVWVRLADINHDGSARLESFSQQLAMAFIRAELGVGLKGQVSRGATKLETLGTMSLERTSVLCAKSDLSSSSTRLLMVCLEFDNVVLRLSAPPPTLRQLLHYDALANHMCIKFRDGIYDGALLAEPHFSVLMNAVAPQEMTYEVLVYHDTEIFLLPESPTIRLNHVQCNYMSSPSSGRRLCSKINFHFSEQNAAGYFLKSLEKMRKHVLQKYLSGPIWQEKVIYQQYDAKQAPESKLGSYGWRLTTVFNPRSSQYRLIFNQCAECKAACFIAGADLFGLLKGGLSSDSQSCPVWTVERLDSGELEHQKIPWSDVVRCCPPGPQRAINATMTHGESEVSPNTWMENFDDFIAVLKAKKMSGEIDKHYKRVKIAILDTGIRKDHRMVHKIVYHDFVGEDNANPQDLTGHGTNSIELILKACVDAELFVGRIFAWNGSDEKLGPTLMAKGIDWARDQKVDIISISAGFKRTALGCPTPLRDAVDQAAKAGILIFAAASNWGNKDDIAYPAAIKDQVMCIFSTDGANRHSRAFNPDSRDAADNFAILGENVKITGEGGCASGTSVATALAAGLAGRIIDFCRHTDSRAIDNLKLIGTKAGMTAVLKSMSKGGKEGYDCIIPWMILEDAASDRVEQRSRAQSKISSALRKAT